MPAKMSRMSGCKHRSSWLRRKLRGTHRLCEHPGHVQARTEAVRQAATEFRLSSGQTLAEASESRPLALVFLRHFGCTFTRQILRGLENLQAAAAAHNADFVIVHMLKSGEEVRYLAGHDNVLRVADPNCELYRAFGLGRGGVFELLGPRVWVLGAISIFKGCGVGHLAGDGLQMPGAFLFQRGEIIAAQRAKYASDMPDLQRLFEGVTDANVPTGIRN